MILKFIYMAVVFILCVALYVKFKDRQQSLLLIILGGLISAIIGNVFIPNVSIFDALANDVEKQSAAQTDNPGKDPDGESNSAGGESNSAGGEGKAAGGESKSTAGDDMAGEGMAMENGESGLEIAPITTKLRSIDAIPASAMEVDPTSLLYFDGTISQEGQTDTYRFTAPVSGRYRFEFSDMLSGVKADIAVLNPAGEDIRHTSYGVTKGEGVTVDDITAGEEYTIQVKYVAGCGAYQLLTGCQKNTVDISGYTEVSDSIQYREQRNVYEFRPERKGRYRFEMADMISGAKVDVTVVNAGGGRVDGTSYGVENGGGLTINDMAAGEAYKIYVTQYESFSQYTLMIGHQKEAVEVAGGDVVEDSLQYTAQCNEYNFVPDFDGRYRFEISGLVSGVKVDMRILNQAGGQVDSTSYGIENGGGLTIDNMVAGETYTIQILQYESLSGYKLLIGRQKETVDISAAGKVTDSVQYTDQNNVYTFVPKADGNYKIRIDEMVSGMKIDFSCYNQGGSCIDRTSYGVENGYELPINDMVAGEIYTINVTRYDADGRYTLSVQKGE